MPLNSSAQALEVKISRAFESIQVKRKVQAPTAISLNTTTTTPRPFDPVYTKEPVAGRDYIPHVYDYYNRGKTTDRKKWELCGEQGQDVRRFLMLSQNDFTETEAYTICGYFVDALNRWPDVERLAIVPGTRTKTNPETSHLLNSILVQEFPDRAIEVGAPGLIKAHGGNNWRWQVRTARIDPESFELHLHLRTLGIQTIGRDADDPEKTTFTDTQTLNSFNDVLDETTQANFLRTERFLQWYSGFWARTGPFISATAAKCYDPRKEASRVPIQVILKNLTRYPGAELIVLASGIAGKRNQVHIDKNVLLSFFFLPFFFVPFSPYPPSLFTCEVQDGQPSVARTSRKQKLRGGGGGGTGNLDI